MTKRIFLHEGERFGRLTVLKGDIVCSETGQTKAHCACDCGKHVTKVVSHIRKGKIRSCGCLKKETHEKTFKKANDNKRIDINIGERFGFWEVLQIVGVTKRGSLDVFCRCECGTERILRGTRLINNQTLSCGCQRGLLKSFQKR